MKKFIFIFTLMLSFVLGSKAQQTVTPTLNKEVTCQVVTMDDEGTVYQNVTVKFKCGVKFGKSVCQTKVTICDENGKKIVKKTLKDALLYVYDNGQIQVGKPGMNQILIYKNKQGNVVGKIRQNQDLKITD